MPRRLVDEQVLTVPDLSVFKAQIDGTGEREISFTMAFVRILATLLSDKNLGKRVNPIVPDEARTFGMEGMFRQLGIYSSEGQLYEPEDSDELAAYKESKSGQVLKRASMRQGHLLRGWRLRPRIQPINTPCCRFTSTTPCVRFSARWRSGVGGGRFASQAAFCWAVLPGARR